MTDNNRRYVLTAQLPNTSQGLLFVAEDKLLKRQVLIKLANSNSQNDVELFENELSILRRLQHPNTIQLLDIGLSNNKSDKQRPFAVLEYVRGQTLRDILIRCRRIPLSKALYVLGQILLPLQEMHQKSIVHGDIKPENILVLTSGCGYDEIKIINFQSARYAKGSNDEAKSSSQHSNHSKQNYPTISQDLFSVGALLYECISGLHPYETDQMFTENNLPKKYSHRPLHWLAPVPHKLSIIVDKLLNIKSERHYQNISDILDDLTDLQQEDVVTCDINPKQYDLVKQDSRPEDEQTVLQLRKGRQLWLEQTSHNKNSALLPPVPKSSENPTLWILSDDAAFRRTEVLEYFSRLTHLCKTEILDEEASFLKSNDIENGKIQPPWIIVFGGMQVLLQDRLLRQLSKVKETAKFMVSTSPNKELLREAVQWSGVDQIVTLPTSESEIERDVVLTLQQVKRVRRRADILSMEHFDAILEQSWLRHAGSLGAMEHQ